MRVSTIITVTIAQILIKHGSSNTVIGWGSSGGGSQHNHENMPSIRPCLAAGLQNLSTCIDVAQPPMAGQAQPEYKYDCESSRRNFIDWWNDFKKVPRTEDAEIGFVVDGYISRFVEKKKFHKVTRRHDGATATSTEPTDSFSDILTCIKQAAIKFVVCLCEQAKSYEILDKRASEKNEANENGDREAIEKSGGGNTSSESQ